MAKQTKSWYSVILYFSCEGKSNWNRNISQNTILFCNNFWLLPIDETVSWFDGSPLNYSNWGIREPEFDNLKGNFCISLRTSDGVWQLSPCREKKGFVCKMDAGMCFHKRRQFCPQTIVLLVPCCLFTWCQFSFY